MTAPQTDESAIRQTIRALVAAGYSLLHVDDGEESIRVSTESAALEAITAVDEAHLFVTHGPTVSGWVYFVGWNTVSASPLR